MPLPALRYRFVQANVTMVNAPIVIARSEATWLSHAAGYVFAGGLPVICHYAARLPRARSALAMTNLIASRRRMRAAKIANLQGAHNPQGARRIRKAAKPPTAAQ